MDNFTRNEAEGQGKICFMFLCLPLSFLSPESLDFSYSKLFLSNSPLPFSRYSGVRHFIPRCKGMCFQHCKSLSTSSRLLFSLVLKT